MVNNMSELKKLTFDKLIVELTRKCNMHPPCTHCFRGSAEDISIDKKYIDGLLNQTEIIGSLFFTGGEPTLCVDEMAYFLDKLYENRIPLFDFGFITNGLIYNEKIIDIIKRYSKLIKLCCEIGSGNKIDVEKSVVIGISIDKYHNNKELAEENLKKYKNALQGYAQVVKVADGNIPRKEGNGKTLSNGLCNLNLEQAVIKRIEILDDTHKPLCPQYQTYKMIKPEQTIICCDMYLSSLGNLLIASLGLHEYFTVDYEKCIICNVLQENIYEAIIRYNVGKIDCCNLLKITNAENMKNPFRGLKDTLFYLQHKDEDDSDVIKKDLPVGYINLEKLAMQSVTNPKIIDNIIVKANAKDYLN